MSSQLQNAIELDIDLEVEAAAVKYEEVLATADAPIDAFINAAFLYWQSTDYGFNIANRLPPEFIGHAAQRYGEILAEARRKFGEDAEIVFWAKYFDFVSLGEPPFVEFCLELLKGAKPPQVIYIHLFAELRNADYIPPLQQLLHSAEEFPTTKNRYIASVIRSLLRQVPAQ